MKWNDRCLTDYDRLCKSVNPWNSHAPEASNIPNEIDKWNWHQMYHVGRDKLAHVRWKSRPLLAVVCLSFGVNLVPRALSVSTKDNTGLFYSYNGGENKNKWHFCLRASYAWASIVFYYSCEIIIPNWIRFNSSGNFKASPRYCHESLSEGAKFDESKHLRNLDLATTSYGCSTPKLGRKLLETTNNKIRMLTFLERT